MPAESRFAFGDNWASYAKLVGEGRSKARARGSSKLLPAASFAGRSFLDIGCGSGLHALAAARLGVAPRPRNRPRPEERRHHRGAVGSARRGRAVDGAARRRVRLCSRSSTARYDIVYSWGVLHHTGDVTEALGKAAALVAPGEHLPSRSTGRRGSIASGWRRSAGTPRRARARQRLARAIYVGTAARPPRPHGAELQGSYVEAYKARGMDFGPRRPRLARRLPLPDHKRARGRSADDAPGAAEGARVRGQQIGHPARRVRLRLRRIRVSATRMRASAPCASTRNENRVAHMPPRNTRFDLLFRANCAIDAAQLAGAGDRFHRSNFPELELSR